MLPQLLADIVGEVVEVNPNVAPGPSGEIFPADLLKLLRQVGDRPVGVEGQPEAPVDLCRRRIDQSASRLRSSSHALVSGSSPLRLRSAIHASVSGENVTVIVLLLGYRSRPSASGISLGLSKAGGLAPACSG
jgi:hypothetical protein